MDSRESRDQDGLERYHLTCVCGWDETGSREWCERRAVSHGASKDRHKWTITSSDGEVVDRGR